MNLYHLRYFVTLAHLEHYTKAAEKLMITQPSLSHAISSLEHDLGVKLFEKDGRNIVLTKYGKMFLNDVEDSLKILDSGVKNLQMTASGEGNIDIAFLRTLGTDFVPEIVRSFLNSDPTKNIQFHFYTGVTSTIIEGLKDNRYDIAICSKVEKEQMIEFTPVATQDLVVIVYKDHPLAGRDAVDLEETLPYPYIYFKETSGLRPIIDRLFEKIDARPEILYEIEEDQVVAGMVASNFGIAVVPSMYILDSLNVKVLPIKSPSYERRFYLAVMRDKYLPPAVERFRQFVLDHAMEIE